MCELSHGCQTFMALMSVNKGNVTGKNTASAALQPHLTQQMQNVSAGNHVCANFMLACVDGPFLASKEIFISVPKGSVGKSIISASERERLC